MPHFSFASFFSSSVLLFCSENLVIAPHSPSPLFFFFFFFVLLLLYSEHIQFAVKRTLLFPRKLGQSGKIYFLISAWKGNWASSDANWVFAVLYIIHALGWGR